MKKVTRLAVAAAHGRDVEVGHVVGDRRVVGRAVDGDGERVAAAVERGVVVGVVDRLLPRRAAGLGHDRRDDVHELRDAGDLHPVGAADEGVEGAADQQHVLEIVDVLQDRRRLLPVDALAVVADAVLRAAVVPDVPLVEGDVDVVLRALLRLDVVDDAADGVDVAVEQNRSWRGSSRCPSRSSAQ